MNQTSVKPAPHILVHLLEASDPGTQATAAQFLVDLLQADDPLTRWGTVSYLLHTPMRFYLNPLVERLQEEDQSPTVRICAGRLKKAGLRSSPASAALIVFLYLRLRFLLYLVSDLHHGHLLNHA
jgi:HEAT repeat protein